MRFLTDEKEPKPMGRLSMFEKKKIALALGGGAARGIANIGVLKVLERERVPIDFVVGSSIGALIGAAYCLGVPTYHMEEAALKFSWKNLADPSISRISLLKGKKLERIIEEFTDKKTFKDMRLPMAVTTTDIETGEELVHTKGPLQKIIKASCSWPGIFPPVVIAGRKLCDGGIKNSIPVKMARHMGPTHVIAVDIGFSVKRGRVDNLFQYFMQSIQILGEELDSYQSMQADFVIKPKLHNIDQFAFHSAKQALIDGEEAAKKALPLIKKKLKLDSVWKR